MRPVGTVELELVDGSRGERLGSDIAGRRLRLKLWYPAEPGHGGGPERLWASMRERPGSPLPLRLALGLLRDLSGSHPGAPRAPVAGPLPVLYNHGLVSFAAENSRLMEALAARGHTVVAVEHAAQLAEWQALERTQSRADRARGRDLQRRLQRTAGAARGRLALEYVEASVNANAVVRERARDSRFVLDRLAEAFVAIPGSREASATRVIACGFSLGGAVSLTLAQEDARVAGVVNLDGGTQGVIDASTVTAPCLMLYSERNAGLNDALLPPSSLRETAPAGSRHLNLHDAAALWPRTLRLLGATGPVDPAVVLAWRDRLVTGFCAGLS